MKDIHFYLLVGVSCFCLGGLGYLCVRPSPLTLVVDQTSPRYLDGFLNKWILESTRDMDSQASSITPFSPAPNERSCGVNRDISYLGKVRVKKDPQNRSYCVGMVLQVYMDACERYAQDTWGSGEFQLRGVPSEGFSQFRKDFYGVSGNRRTLVEALVSRGLAVEIKSIEEAQPGDLMQVWRKNGTGHCAIFLDLDDRTTPGVVFLEYWSIQRKGLGRNAERFGGTGIDPMQVYIARPLPPEKI